MMKQENSKISSQVIQFIKFESKDNLIHEGTKEFDRSLREIKAKLKEGNEVLTLINNNPVRITLSEEGKVVIQSIKN